MAGSLDVQNSVNWSFWINRPTAQLTHATATSFTNNTQTPMPFDTSVIDNWSGHSNVTNNSRYTIPVAGVYQISGSCSWAQNATGYRLLSIFKNGVEVAQTRSYGVNGNNVAICTNVLPTTFLRLVVGDYIELYTFQNSGGNLTVSGGGGNNFSIQWMMP